jgi:Mor family transcriptional regulator
MSDVWGDELFERARTRAERLLMAGIDYCEHQVVAYVAKKPPRQEMKSWAGRFGKKIVYLPIGQFSPDTLRKLRVFHVLFGKDKREVAKDYVW